MADKAKVRFQRANFVVADIDRAMRFYGDVLGFTEEFRKGHNPESYSFPVFEIAADAVIGFAVLSAPGQPRCMALSEVKNMAMPPVPLPRRSAIVLEVADPDAVMAGARALGLVVHPEGKLITNDGRTGREIGILDFDDNLVVIYTIADAA